MKNEIENLKTLYQMSCKMVDGRLKGGFINHDDPVNKAIDSAIAALEAQQADRWVPVNSELDYPFENREYQVTIKYENFAGIYIKTGIASCCGGKWTILGNQPVITNKKIIAWKPLDEPYDPLAVNLQKILDRESDRISGKK